MEKKSSEDRLSNIERKLDLIIDAMGLSNNHRLAPAEVKQISQKILMQFNEKKQKKSKCKCL